MNNLESLLLKNTVRYDFYWKQVNYESSIEIWNSLAKKNPIYAAVAAKDERKEQRKTVKTIGLLKSNLNDGNILDLGCGYGRIAKYLLPVRKFTGYVGVDGSVNMLKIFSDRYTNTQEKETPLLLINSDIDNIPLNDCSVDNVIISAVFLHNHKNITKKSIGEVFRLMKPGAKLFIISSFPNICNLVGLQGTLYLWILKIFGCEFKNGPLRYFSKNEVSMLLNKFKKIEINPVGFSMIPKSIIIFPEFLNPLYRRVVFNPTQYLLEKMIPDKFKATFCAHYDVIAYK